jgi:hypothetical protein
LKLTTLAVALVSIGAATAASAAKPAPAAAPAPVCEAAAIDATDAALMRSEARRMILSSLKDPESARFDAIFVFRLSCNDGRRDFACTSVNAKNSFGGYTGATPWLYARLPGVRPLIWSAESRADGADRMNTKTRLLGMLTECIMRGSP